MRFRDRVDAGRQLAAHVRGFVDPDTENIVVLGLPRGGVPVAREVARALAAPLDVLLVRKIGFPDHPELGIGAIGEGGVRILDRSIIDRANISASTIAAIEAAERTELARRARLYRGDRAPRSLQQRTALIVDDGLATGGTARAAIAIARALGAARVLLAVPVGPADTVAALEAEADGVIVLSQPRDFRAVGEWYDDFTQTSDDEVVAALADAEGVALSRTVRFAIGAATLEGTLDIPDHPKGLVVFVHGSGSSRRSPRNRAVARQLHRAGFATLLFDLLTEGEATNRALVFDTEFLAGRLQHVVRWAGTQPELAALPLGLFGASTGAGAALRVAASPGVDIRAVVARGGRPDLAGDRLGAVRCPTLLIVGGADLPTREVNEAAAAQLRCPHETAIIRGATHLFEEPGALETVGQLAADWFGFHLDGRNAASKQRAPAS